MTRIVTRITLVLLLGWLLPSTLGCASIPVSPALTAFTTMQLRERAGIYPEDWAVPGDDHAPALRRLEAWTNGRGIFVLPAPIGRKRLLGHVAYSRALGWVILLDESMTPNNQLYTLLHELGHVFGPDPGTEQAREVIAELVAASACAQLGLDVWPQTTAYLAVNVDLDTQVRTAHRYGPDIDRVVARLVIAAQEHAK